MKSIAAWTCVLLACGAIAVRAQDVLIGNETLSLRVTAAGSSVGGVMEYPPGTQQGYIEAYWVRYGGQSYYSQWPLPVSDAAPVAVTDEMHYTANGADGVEAEGSALAGQIEVKTIATALPGHNWLRLTYTLINTGDQPAENVRFFQFADMDVGPAGVGGAVPENQDDTARFVSDLNAVYTADNVADPSNEPPGLVIGIMSPVAPDHHDVYGGPNPDFPYPVANPAYLNLQQDTLDDSRIEFTGDVGMTLEWDIGTLAPGESATIPVYFFCAFDENDVPDIFDEVGILPIPVDVKPESSDNPMNLKSRGVLPVAILASEGVALEQIDPSTLLLGDPQLSGRIPPSHRAWEDANGDGLKDLVLQFLIPDLVSAGAASETSLSLGITGKTRQNIQVAGEDAIRIVPSKK